MGTFIQTCGDVNKNKTHLDRKVGVFGDCGRGLET